MMYSAPLAGETCEFSEAARKELLSIFNTKKARRHDPFWYHLYIYPPCDKLLIGEGTAFGNCEPGMGTPPHLTWLHKIVPTPHFNWLTTMLSWTNNRDEAARAQINSIRKFLLSMKKVAE